MDQPQQGDDNVNNGNQPQADQPVQINVNVDSAPQQGDDTFEQDPITDGVPGAESFQPAATDPNPVAVEVPMATTEPAASTDELASVASELQSLSVVDTTAEEAVFASPEPDPAPSSFGGTDPMQQIMNEAEESPAVDVNTTPYVNTPEVVNLESPSTDPMGETPAEPALTQNEAAVFQSSSQEVPAEQFVDVAELDQTDQNIPTETVNMAVANEPMSESNAEAVSMANQAELDSAETVDQASLISDVIAPSAIAVASVAGSAGQNAITGTPESSTVELSQGAELANQLSQKQHRPNSGKGKLVFVVILVTLIFGGGAVAAYMLSADSADKNEATTAQTTETDQTNESQNEVEVNTSKTSTPGEKVEAKALDDYKAACSSGGLVSNATAYAGASPHATAVFEKGIDDKFALSLVSFKDKTWSADPAKVTSGQLVTCISRKAASEVKLKSCPITDSTTKVTTNIDFYSTKYTVDVIEAKTGKKVTTFDNSSTSTICPTNASFNKADPKIFAGFDLITLEASLKDPITKAL